MSLNLLFFVSHTSSIAAPSAKLAKPLLTAAWLGFTPAYLGKTRSVSRLYEQESGKEVEQLTREKRGEDGETPPRLDLAGSC